MVAELHFSRKDFFRPSLIAQYCGAAVELFHMKEFEASYLLLHVGSGARDILLEWLLSADSVEKLSSAAANSSTVPALSK